MLHARFSLWKSDAVQFCFMMYSQTSHKNYPISISIIEKEVKTWASIDNNN